MIRGVETVRDAWAGLVSRPGKTAIAFGAISVSAAALSLLLSVLGGFRERIEQLAGEMGLGTVALLSAEGAAESGTNARPLTRRQVERIRANVPGSEVSGVRFGTTPGPAGHPIRVVYTDEHLARVRGWQMTEGRFLDPADVSGQDRSFVATGSLAEAAGWRIGSRVRLDGRLYRFSGRVRLDEESLAEADSGGCVTIGDRAVFLAARPPGAGGNERVDIIFVRTSPQDDEEGRARIRRIVEQPDFGAGPLRWVTPGSLTAGLRRVELTARAVSGAGLALGLFLGGSMLSGLWVTNVRDRVPEVGLRRAMGGGRREVGALFLAEALLVSTAAGLAGTALAQIAIRYFPETLPVVFSSGGLGAWVPPVISFMAGAFFSWTPARIASRIEPAEALRTA